MTQPDVSQPGWPTVEGFGRCGVKAIAEPAAVERIRSSGVFGQGKTCPCATLRALSESVLQA
ncbi:hypothetical protein LMG28727_01756 [Paraburkholderia kirstenboschensis]|nr:hypothetical protein LMG28727_01756 [Paraburkholderia kirstenboschensis]